jgi:hypothetical protein
MARRDERADPRRTGANCNDLTEAALGAEQLISRVQDIMAEGLEPGNDQVEAFGDIVEELDPAPEGDALRDALGMDHDGTRVLPKQAAARSR